MNAPASNSPGRSYAVFISYRHADNKDLGRKWANWLHEALEGYEVPPDLVGTTNQRGDTVPASLYPVFRDEEELPADADLNANIRRALENSGLLVVLCSPRAVQSRFVADEIRCFKELGKCERILALIIDGEPNASDDPAKFRQFGPDAECFPEPLRFGGPMPGVTATGHNSIDWSARTEPIAADVRPGGRPGQGWTTAAAYREELEKAGCLATKQIAVAVRDYAECLELAKLKIIAGALGLPLGMLTQRDKALQLAKERQRAKVLMRWLAVVAALALSAVAGGYLAWQQKQRAVTAERETAVQLKEAIRQYERSQLEQARVWFERARLALNEGDNGSALMLAGRATGFMGYGRQTHETADFPRELPLLLGEPMTDPKTEKERREAKVEIAVFIHKIQPTFLPLWFSPAMSGVKLVAFSPDGTRLASGSIKDKSIKLWDVATGRELTELATGRPARDLAFSPDSTRLAGATVDKTIKVWDVATGKLVATCQGNNRLKELVVFSPDGRRLAASNTIDGTIEIWDTESATEVAGLKGHAKGVTGLAFSSDGTRLASASRDKTIKLWDVEPGTLLATFPGHQIGETEVAFSPDGTRLASFNSVERAIHLWDTAGTREAATLGGHTAPVSSVAFNADGTRLFSGSWDGTIRLWETSSGRALASFRADEAGVAGLSLSPDGTRLATCTYDKSIKLWDVAAGKELTAMHGHTGEILSAAFSRSDALAASASADNTVRLWDVQTGKELAAFPVQTHLLTRLAFSPDDKSLACQSPDDGVRLWDVVTGKHLPIPDTADAAKVRQWFDDRRNPGLSKNGRQMIVPGGNDLFIMPAGKSPLDLASCLRRGLLSLPSLKPQESGATPASAMLHARQDTLAKLADPSLTPERRAELRMELCTKSSQFRAATALWQQLLQGEWPGFEGATVPKVQAPTTITADSPIRRLYLLALIDATKHPGIHGQPANCQTTAQIAPVVTKDMMALPAISLAMMSLMQTLAKDGSTAMASPRAALMKRLEEVATKEWLEVLREIVGK